MRLVSFAKYLQNVLKCGPECCCTTKEKAELIESRLMNIEMRFCYKMLKPTVKVNDLFFNEVSGPLSFATFDNPN